MRFKTLIMLCLMLMLLLAVPVMGQSGNVISLGSYGVMLDADGKMSDITHLSVGTFVSSRVFLVGQAGTTFAGLSDTEDSEYGFGVSVGYLASNKFIASGAVWGLRNDKKSDSTIVNYGTIGGALSYFPLGTGLFKSGEKIGLTLGAQYTPGTKRLLYGVGIMYLIGK